ncbi:MAG: extracellular solute-binding protein, partial [Limnochordia bacterium]|nr:extracellular solute-binding protein [Limnochordia bacterium]
LVLLCSFVLGTSSLVSAAARIQFVSSDYFSQEGLAVMQWAVDEFNKRNPDIEVEWTNKPGGYHEYLVASSAAGNPPDVFYVRPGTDAYLYLSGLIKALDPFIERDQEELNPEDFLEAQVGELKFDGKWWCIPANLSTLMIRYNKVIFAEAGIAEPGADWDWDDVLETSTKLTKTDPGSGVPTFWGFGNMAWFLLNSFSEGIIMSFDGQLLTDDGLESHANSPGTVAALTFLNEMGQRSAFPMPGSGGDPWAVYGQTKAAMTMGGSWELSGWGITVEDKQAEDVTMLPMGPAGKRVVTATGGAWAMSSISKHPEEAWRFLKWLVSPEVLERQLLVLHSSFPPRQSLLPAWIDGLAARIPGAYTMAEQLVVSGKPLSPRLFSIDSVLPGYFWPVAQGTLSPQEAALRMEEDLNRAIAEALKE